MLSGLKYNMNLINALENAHFLLLLYKMSNTNKPQPFKLLRFGFFNAAFLITWPESLKDVFINAADMRNVCVVFKFCLVPLH